MGEFTAREKAACADREVGQRQRVYGRMVEEGRMHQERALREIALMQEIAADYYALAVADEPELFGNG